MTDDTNLDLDDRAAMPSLCDPSVAAKALEAFVAPDDRLTGGLAFFFCDADGRLLQPVLIADPPDPLTDELRRAAISWATDLCAVVTDDGAGPLSLVFAVTREEGPVGVADWAWHEAALAGCADAGVRLLSVHLVTMEGATLMPPVTRAA